MSSFRITMGTAAIGAAMVATALASTLSGGAPAQAAAQHSSARPFAAQATAAHLTGAQADALQAKVEVYLAKFRGTQVALNEIAFRGGRVLVALPGEKHPRNFATGSFRNPCGDGQYNGWFCAFRSEGFQGDELDWFYCGTYDMPWYGSGSWINNQTRGTEGRFYGANGYLIGRTGGSYSWSLAYPWAPVYKVTPC